MVVIRYLAARYELWCSVAARYKTFTNPNHIRVTRVTLFIRRLFVSLLSILLRRKWKWIQICVRRWVRHVFSLGCSHRRQNGTILGKFRWKNKNKLFWRKTCFDATRRQLKSAVGCEWPLMLKTPCFAQRGVQRWSLVDCLEQSLRIVAFFVNSDRGLPSTSLSFWLWSRSRFHIICNDGFLLCVVEIRSNFPMKPLVRRIRLTPRSENLLQTEPCASSWTPANSYPCTSPSLPIHPIFAFFAPWTFHIFRLNFFQFFVRIFHSTFTRPLFCGRLSLCAESGRAAVSV